jgi:hypothetical protein
MFLLSKHRKLAALMTLTGLLLFYLAYRAGRQEIYHPTTSDFGKIRFDLTEDEVEAILGPPHKVLTSTSSKREFFRPKNSDVKVKVFLYYGPTNENKQYTIFVIDIDADGRVVGYGDSGTGSEKPLLEQLKEWISSVLGL